MVQILNLVVKSTTIVGQVSINWYQDALAVIQLKIDNVVIFTDNFPMGQGYSLYNTLSTGDHNICINNVCVNGTMQNGIWTTTSTTTNDNTLMYVGLAAAGIAVLYLATKKK